VKPSIAFAAHRETVRRVVESHCACNARVFGSVVLGEDTEGSDLDLLIDPLAETTLFDIGAIRHELSQLLGVSVDVLTPKALPENFALPCLLRRSRYDLEQLSVGRVATIVACRPTNTGFGGYAIEPPRNQNE
jgi:uncharacterized protein